MTNFDICVIGHITKDIIRIKDEQKIIPGGVPYYCLLALQNLGLNNCLVTKFATEDQHYLESFSKTNINLFCYNSQQTTIFEDIYPETNTDIRIENVHAIAEPFIINDIPNISAKIYHLGPLTQKDISLDIIQYLSTQGKISLDVQGFLREIEQNKVKKVDWQEKDEALAYISILKADEIEAKILSGEENLKKAAIKLSNYGIDEIIITYGSKGSLIYYQEEFYSIPPFPPKNIVDATGCGDTYIGGYLYKRLQFADIEEAGNFAAVMASLKLEQLGAFQGSEEDINKRMCN